MKIFAKLVAAGVLFISSCQSVLAEQAIIVDGDTLELNGIKHHLQGMDTPEAGQKCNKLGRDVSPYGKAALALNNPDDGHCAKL